MSEQLNLNQTSSIGAAWPPAASPHNRLRGFYDERVLLTEEDVAQFGEIFRAYVTETGSYNGPDRLSIRAVTSIGALALLGETSIDVEAAIPFSRNDDRLALAYVGWNQPSRSVSAADLASHVRLLNQAVQRPLSSLDPGLLLEQKGFSPKVITPDTAADLRASLVDRFTDLYAAFDYDAEDVRELLNNPGNTIAYIEDGDIVISTAMAESGQVNIVGFGELNIIEITEAFTRKLYRGRGLYKAISGYLIDALISERDSGARAIDVIYGESNLAMPGVVFAGHENGRRFSHFDSQRLGINNSNFGILPQNFSVKDGVETRDYNDFAVSYVPLG